jgi:hypothetical protein
MLNWFKQLFSSASGPRRSERAKPYYYSSHIPERLGIRSELAEGTRDLVRRLEIALKEPYLTQVKERVLSRHPAIGDAAYGWMELEMKRFFVLTALQRNVPMYSDDVDLIWHEMLMFTREYQQFCDEFTGFYIHHRPNISADSSSFSDTQNYDRDMFELVYAALYDTAPENLRLLGSFYQRKTNSRLMDELLTMDPARLRTVLQFRDTPDPVVGTVQDAIISNILDKTEQARFYHSESDLGRQSSYYGGVDPLWTIMAFGMATQFSPFQPSMDAEEEARRNGGTSCTAYVPGSTDSGNDDGGDNSGGSSCSSSDDGSSSSCSSSCGGGGGD